MMFKPSVALAIVALAGLGLVVGTTTCKDTSVNTGFDTFQWSMTVRVKFDNFDTYYPMIVLSSNDAFAFHGMGSNYGANSQRVSFYLHTKAGIGFDGRGIDQEIMTNEKLNVGQWYTLKVEKGLRFISIAVDDNPAKKSYLDSQYTDDQFEMKDPASLTLGGPGLTPASYVLNGAVQDLCWEQPTDSPTDSPTGSPTIASPTVTTSPWSTGKDGEDVYMCSTFCFKNSPNDRNKWVFAASADHVTMGNNVQLTTSDGGIFDVGVGGIRITIGVHKYFTPFDCNCDI